MNTPERFVGIDVSSEHLDVHVRPDGTEARHPNDPDGIAAVVAALVDLAPERVVLEATGHYERPLFLALLTAGLPAVVVNPRQARNFAIGVGYRAKTDRLDAAVLARFAEAVRPPVRPLRGETVVALEAINVRRRQLMSMRQAEANRLRTEGSAAVRASLEAHVAFLDEQLAALDREAAAVIAADPEARAKAERLREVPGVGDRTIQALLGGLPELGTMSRQEIASLVGLAPWARDSGKQHGPRSIGGGRAMVRSALYLAALSGSQFNPALKRFRERLREAKKPPKVALTAVARKLVTILNAMLRDDRPWSRELAERES